MLHQRFYSRQTLLPRRRLADKKKQCACSRQVPLVALVHLIQLSIVPLLHRTELLFQLLGFCEQLIGALASELKKKTAYELL